MLQVLKSVANIFSGNSRPAGSDAQLSKQHLEIDSQEQITTRERLAQVLKEHRVNPDILENGTLHGIFSVEGGRLQCQMAEGVSIVLIQYRGHPRPKNLVLKTFEEPPVVPGAGVSAEPKQPELKLAEATHAVAEMISGALSGFGHINIGNYDRLVRDPQGHAVLCYVGGKSTVMLKAEQQAKNASPATADAQQ